MNYKKDNQMEKFKGTKGKWVFDSQSMKIKGTGDIEGMTVIANVSPNMDYSRGMTTQSFNAQLISKAPEMLEALTHCLEILDKCLIPHDMVETYGNAIQNYSQLINEATEI